MVSLSSGILQFLSNAYQLTPEGGSTTSPQSSSLAPLNKAIQSNTGSQVSATGSATGQLADDTYTPSGQSASGSSTANSTPAASSVPGLSASVVTAIGKALTDGNYYAEGEAYDSLVHSLDSGDLSAAQTAVAQYQQALENPVNQISALTTPTQQLLSSVASVGAALNSGDLASARSIFSTDVVSQGSSILIGSALRSANGQLSLDGQTTVGAAITSLENGASTTYQSGSSYQADTAQIATDFETYDALVREDTTLQTNYLVTQGFSITDATTFLEGVSQGSYVSPTGNQSTDTSLAKVQTAQYAQAIDQVAQNYVASKSAYSPSELNFQSTLNQVLDDTLSSQADQTKSLIQETLGISNTAQSPSAAQ